MSGPPRVISKNCTESESRPVLVPAGNKTRTIDTRNQASKPQRKVEKPQEIDDAKGKRAPSLPVISSTPSEPRPTPVASKCFTVPSILKQQDPMLFKSNWSLNASCSSDASSDSSYSRASTGRISRSVTPMRIRRRQFGPKREKVEKVVTDSETGSAATSDGLPVKKRCTWVTPHSDLCYVAFHDEEWGVPVHNDRKLFELLVYCIALAEHTWPAILHKRQIFREVFLDFDPLAVSRLNGKKTVTPGSAASTLLSELKLRAIIENAHHMCKIIDEFGSFNKYIWGFVNHKPIVGHFRYPRQVPIKTSKADGISKDLVRRGFRGVGPTVIYSFMQVAGLTNDHLISCFRFQDCVAAADASEGDCSLKSKVDEKQPKDLADLVLASAIDDFTLSTD